MIATLLALSIGTAARVCVGLLFLCAAAAKLRHRAAFPAVVANYRLLPAPLVRPVAAALPVVELVLGGGLVVGGRAAGIAAAPAAVLLLAFAGAMAVNIRRGRAHIDCGCGVGGLRQSLHPALVARNLGLAAALAPLPLLVAGGLAPVAPAAVVPVAAAAGAVAAGLAAWLLLLFLDALLALPAPAPIAHRH